jgi:hypothetical protein
MKKKYAEGIVYGKSGNSFQLGGMSNVIAMKEAKEKKRPFNGIL